MIVHVPNMGRVPAYVTNMGWVDPNMGFDLFGGLEKGLSTAVSIPLGLVGAVTKPVLGSAGQILTQATSALSPALQALRPPPAPVAPAPASNLPLYIGGAAALLVLAALLLGPKKAPAPAPAPAVVGP